VEKLHEIPVPPVVFALYFFNDAETALNYPIALGFGTINNKSYSKKVQSSDTGAPKAWRLD
jgi:hypothetical protein